MCQADENGDLVHEIMSAMSSLNMYPEPIPGAEGYLSETDEWAKHSMEHLRAAVTIAGRQQKQLNDLLCKIDSMLTFCHPEVDCMPLEGDCVQWAIDTLGAMVKKARDERKDIRQG